MRALFLWLSTYPVGSDLELYHYGLGKNQLIDCFSFLFLPSDNHSP